MCFGVENELDIALGNHALRARLTDKSVFGCAEWEEIDGKFNLQQQVTVFLKTQIKDEQFKSRRVHLHLTMWTSWYRATFSPPARMGQQGRAANTVKWTCSSQTDCFCGFNHN